MKKVVIVEDKPWVTSHAVQCLQEKKVEVMRFVYYPNAFGDDAEKTKLIDDLRNTTQVQIDIVNNQEEFISTMEELYQVENVVFFMDYDLKGDYTVEPDSRINIRYAKYKEYGEEPDNAERKIWFYTVSGATNVEVISRNFPDRVLHIDEFKEGQLSWNTNEITHILE